MKFIFEAEDIIANRPLRKKDTNERFVIGAIHLITYPTQTIEYCIVSLSTGIVSELKSAEQLAKRLTDNNFMPEDINVDLKAYYTAYSGYQIPDNCQEIQLNDDDSWSGVGNYTKGQLKKLPPHVYYDPDKIKRRI